MKKLAIAAATIASLSTMNAQAFNDNYLQVGYEISDSTFFDSILSVKGSKTITEGIFLTGEYQYSDAAWVDPSKREEQSRNHYIFKITKTFSLSDNTQPLIGIGYTSNNYDRKIAFPEGSVRKYHFGGSYNEIFAGIRHKTDNDLVLTGTAGVTTNESGIYITNFKIVDLEATKSMSKNYHVGANYKYLTDDNLSYIFGGVFVRRDF